ncbi:MAG: DUF1735 domain-containing protein [Bacteroidales bacterium]|nr:DUF1735 domain-containing protein [Bacteroidales bacterium]MBR0037161.1 DUF1735 domain-containing protein [Bacteroidales bacterium]
MKKYIIFALCAVFGLNSCENDDVEFPDFDYQTVYFATQTPVRTITLGDDEVAPTDLDNLHRCQIYATMGGVNKNKKCRSIQIAIDETLCEGLQFEDGRDVKPMPRNYYTLSDNIITISSGDIMGCVDVQLSDAFFTDSLCTQVNYVIPVRMISATDSILSGKDYVLYAVKYKNRYHGCWLSKGSDVVSIGTESDTITRQPNYWEDADLVYLTTDGLMQSRYPVSVNVTVVNASGKSTIETKTCELILTFDADNLVNITTDTPNCTATGSGKWEYKAAKKAWGQKDRDQLTLQYEVSFSYESAGQPVTTTRRTQETLIMRDRQSKYETFSTK